MAEFLFFGHGNRPGAGITDYEEFFFGIYWHKNCMGWSFVLDGMAWHGDGEQGRMEISR